VNRSEELNWEREYYDKYTPLIDNPSLTDEPKREQLITCPCGARYRIYINCNTPVCSPKDLEDLKINCGNCKRHISEWVMIAGHSADIFNASIGRLYSGFYEKMDGIKIPVWECNKCDWQGDKPLIHPGVCDGNVVDIIDIMCPKCVKGEPKLKGSRKEIDKWWDDWHKKAEQNVKLEKGKGDQ